jgi:fluoroacetyl-CoA thioesterase
MKKTLLPSLEHNFIFRIEDQHTVPSLLPESPIFSSMPGVLASGYFVGLIEWACMEAMAPHLEEGEGSVGTMFDLTHTSPTPPGLQVSITVRCLEVEGRRTLWEFEARDDKEPIGRGKHERFIVNWERFRVKLEEKTS